MLPQGEDAKRLSIVETAASELAGLRVERREPLIAVGGGALGDTAGFVAATYLRGVPFIQVPTTLVAQLDSSIGGKTGVDLPEGKNLVGAFHQPAAIVADISVLASLDVRQRRAALAEAVKMAALGDERLFLALEARGNGDRRRRDVRHGLRRARRGGRAGGVGQGRGRPGGREGGGRANGTEPGALAGPRGRGGRRASASSCTARPWPMASAPPRGSASARGVTPQERADRIERLLDRLELGVAPLRLDLEVVLDHLEADKKHEAGALRWVLPTADGHTIDKEVPLALVRDVTSTVLAGRGAAVAAAVSAPPRRRPMSRILVLQGPNLNLLGTREPDLYGSETLDQVHTHISRRALDLGLTIVFFQSNHEGELIDRLHERDFDGALVNAAGLTHTSVSLRDALLAVDRPFVEVHLTDPSKREPFRSVNYLEDIALTSVVGKGAAGYSEALDFLARHLDGAAGA